MLYVVYLVVCLGDFNVNVLYIDGFYVVWKALL